MDRRAQRLSLTAAGELVLAYAEQSAQALDDLRGALQELSGVQSGLVRVGSVEGMVSDFLSRHLANFEQRRPAVVVQVSVLGSRALLETLAAGQVDLALAFNLPQRHPYREHARLEQPLCAIVALTHAFAARRSLAFFDMQGQRVALPDRSFQIRHLIDRMSLRSKVSFGPVVLSNSLEMLKGMVRNTQLLTFLPRYAALNEISSGDLCAVPLQERAFASTRISLVTVRDQRLSLAARTMLDMLKAGMVRHGDAADTPRPR